LLRERSDIETIYSGSDDPEDFLDFFGGPDYYDEACIYDSVDDATACWLQNDWLDQRANDVGWEVHLELSKLLAKRGELVRAKVESIVHELAKLSEEGSDFSWARYGLCLSFLERMKDGELLAIQLLDQAPAGFRDGLFRACYKLNTP
jgi:hypothetical protein